MATTAVPIPSPVKAVTDYNFVSTASPTTNPHKPYIYDEEISRYGNQLMSGFVEQQSALNPIGALEFIHFEESRLHSIVQVNAQAGGAAGATVTLTVQPAYTYTFPTTAQSPYIVANNTVTNPVLNNQYVMFPGALGTQVKAKVSGVTATTFDVTPVILTQSIPATTAATEISIIGNEWGERTGQPDSRNSRLIEYRNSVALSKWTHTSSGHELGMRLWFQVKGLDGKTGWVWKYKGQADEYKRAMNEREMLWLLGELVTNTSANIDPTAPGTEGIISGTFNNGGLNYSYVNINFLAIQDFENISILADQQRGATEYNMWNGLPLNQAVDRLVRNEVKNGAFTYGAFGGDKQRAIDFGFDTFKIGQLEIHYKAYGILTDITTMGAAGQPYPFIGIMVPTDNVGASFYPNKSAKVMVPSMRVNYVSGDGYSRYMEEFPLGGANGVYTTDIDELSYNLRTHSAVEMFAANRWGLVHP